MLSIFGPHTYQIANKLLNGPSIFQQYSSRQLLFLASYISLYTVYLLALLLVKHQVYADDTQLYISFSLKHKGNALYELKHTLLEMDVFQYT